MNLLNRLIDRWLNDKLIVKVVYRNNGETKTEEISVPKLGKIYRSGTEYLTENIHRALEKKMNYLILRRDIIFMEII